MAALSVVLMAVLVVVVPTAVYVLLLWVIDPYEREPVSDLGLMLLTGFIVAPLLTILVERIAGIPRSVYPVLFQLLSAGPPNLWGAIVEETSKGVVILAAFAALRREFDDTLDGLVYGAVVGAGFALAENLLYARHLLSAGSAASVGPGLFFAMFIAGLTQCVFSSFLGAGLGLMREAAPGWWEIPALGFIAAAIFHMAYVALAYLASTGTAAGAMAGVAHQVASWLGVLLVILMVRWAWVRERSIFAQTLPDEVGAGVVSQEELSYLTAGHRVGRQFAALRTMGWRHYQALRGMHEAEAQLAFAKWRQRRGHATDAEVAAARDRLRRIRDEAAREMRR